MKNTSKYIQKITKRLLDTIIILIILIITFPLFIIIAIAVRLSSPGPIIYVQKRAGYKARPYDIYKFRTMKVSSDQNLTWSRHDEERITRVGAFLRDYGLDELPQAVNILMGQMSIVGFRPPLIEQVKDFTPREMKMFDMLPGVLSLAAVKGRRSLTMSQRRELYVQYAENWSLWMDLKILWASLFVVIRQENARELSFTNASQSQQTLTSEDSKTPTSLEERSGHIHEDE